MAIKERAEDLLRKVFARFIPVRPMTPPNDRHLQGSIAHTLTADRLHGILREAEDGNTRRLFALYRDVLAGDDTIQSDFSTRKLAVLGEAQNIQPFDKKVSEDVRAADEIKRMLDDVPCILDRYKELLDSGLYPVVSMEKQFKAATRKGLRYELCGLHHVEPQLYDWTEGYMRIEEVDEATRLPKGTYICPDPVRYIHHRGHLLTTPDRWGGPMRSILFWWIFSAMDRDWWIRFLDRFGAPFIVGKYDQADDNSRLGLQRAFQAATRLFGLVVSKETNVELIQSSVGSSTDAFERFQDYASKRKSKLILGQTLSTNSDPTGIGGGASKEHGQVRSDLQRWDGICLGATMRDQLFTQYLRINGIPGRAPHLTFGGEDAEDSSSISQLLGALSNAGLEFTDEAVETLGQRIGYAIQRKELPPTLPPTLPPRQGPTKPGEKKEVKQFSAALPDPNDIDQVARAGAADLAQAFRGDLAPIRRLIEESTSPEDLERRITLFYADWKPARTAPLIEQALTAYAANGLRG